LVSTASATSSISAVMAAAADFLSRCASAVAERTRSTARRWAIIITQVVALLRDGSKRDALRQTSRRTSCATSSDWAGSRTTLRIRPKTGPDSRS
jgi:hypothetical protein